MNEYMLWEKCLLRGEGKTQSLKKLELSKSKL